MKLRTLSLSALVLVCGTSAWAQAPDAPVADNELFYLLRKTPQYPLQRAERSVQVVNARYEPCARKKEAAFVRVVTRKENGYAVQVIRPEGNMVMCGECLDPQATVPHGYYRYYDDAGTLRAEGRYTHGIKDGVWHRYDDRGRALSDKTYDGLTWEGEQVKLGLASMSRPLDELSAR